MSYLEKRNQYKGKKIDGCVVDGWVGKWVDEGMYVYVGRLVDE